MCLSALEVIHDPPDLETYIGYRWVNSNFRPLFRPYCSQFKVRRWAKSTRTTIQGGRAWNPRIKSFKYPSGFHVFVRYRDALTYGRHRHRSLVRVKVRNVVCEGWQWNVLNRTWLYVMVAREQMIEKVMKTI